MPRFYFHLRNDMFVLDEEGLELPDVGAAGAQAEKFAVDMTAAGVMEQRRFNLHHCIEMADEEGRTVLTVEFGDVVTVEG